MVFKAMRLEKITKVRVWYTESWYCLMFRGSGDEGKPVKETEKEQPERKEEG